MQAETDRQNVDCLPAHSPGHHGDAGSWQPYLQHEEHGETCCGTGSSPVGKEVGTGEAEVGVGAAAGLPRTRTVCVVAMNSYSRVVLSS